MAPSQSVRIVVRPTSSRISDHDIAEVRGDHDAVSDMSGPPDYATLDPNKLSRPITPVPRPKSPTPSQTAAWPLAETDDETRLDSDLSHTSSRPYSRGSKSQKLKFKRNSSKTVNRPDPVAEHRNRKRALSTSSSPNTGQKNRLQIPALSRLASRRSENALPQAGTIGSFSTTLTNSQSAADGQKKRGLVSQLSHGDWTTVGSFFSQSANSGSPHRPVTIGRPFDFRHEGGIGSSSSAFVTHADLTAIPTIEEQGTNNEQTRTSAILMDMRTESRLGNRTSLPVALPNAISPIDDTAFDAGCSRNSTFRASVRTTVNRFQSPPSLENTIVRPRSSARDSPGGGATYDDAAIDRMRFSGGRILFWLMAGLTQACLTIAVASITITLTNAHNDQKVDGGTLIALVVSLVGFLIFGTLLACSYAQRVTSRIVRERTGICNDGCFFKMSPDRIVYWFLIILVESCLISTGAAVTVLAVASHGGEDVDGGTLAWLVVSLFLLLISGLILAGIYARRVSNRIVREHRAEQRDEEWVEMRSVLQPKPSSAGEQSRLARDIIKSASQDIHCRPSDHARVASHKDGLSFNADVTFHNSRLLGHDLAEDRDPRASRIGIARSDSLMRQQDQTSTPSMSSSTTATTDTLAFERIEKPIMSKQSSPPAAPMASDPATVLSAEEMSIISMPKQQKTAYIPHSLGMADLSPEAPVRLNPSVTASTTRSTIASLISSYASEPGLSDPVTRAYTPVALGRHTDAPRPRPVIAALPPIVTEAGTPDSQKSGSRVPGSSPEGDLKTSWSVRDGLATRMATMTPIEERSEAGTRSSLVTGRRISQSQASEPEARC